MSPRRITIIVSGFLTGALLFAVWASIEHPVPELGPAGSLAFNLFMAVLGVAGFGGLTCALVDGWRSVKAAQVAWENEQVAKREAEWNRLQEDLKRAEEELGIRHIERRQTP